MKFVLLGFAAAAFLSCLAAGTDLTVTPPPSKYFTRAQIERGKAYHRAAYSLSFVRIGVTAAFLLLLIYTGAARRLDGIISPITSSYMLRVLLYFVLLFIIYTAVRLPLSYFGSFHLEHRYGFARQALGAWLGDFLKGSAISILLGAGLVAGLYYLLRLSPRHWWLLATGAFALYLAGVTLLKPVVIDPLFNKFTPMQDEQFKSQIVALARKAQIVVGDVLVMDASRRTRHTNAYFTGFGHTKRIVVYDTLLETHTRPEVLCVIAHEIGHWKYAHIYKELGIALAGTLLVLLVVKFAGGALIERMPLGATTLASPASMPLVFLILYLCGVVGMPIGSGISRQFERQADRTALELTGDGETFVQMQVKLARSNASDVSPGAFFYYWFYSHPTTMERIAVGEEYGG